LLQGNHLDVKGLPATSQVQETNAFMLERQKRNLTVNQRHTCLSLEKAVWQALEDIATVERTDITQLCNQVDHRRGTRPLASALRVFSLSYFRLYRHHNSPPSGESPQIIGGHNQGQPSLDDMFEGFWRRLTETL